MSVKAIEKVHVTKHRDGSTSNVLLSAYRKKGAYKVSRGPNRVEDEVSLRTLDEVLPYLEGIPRPYAQRDRQFQWQAQAHRRSLWIVGSQDRSVMPKVTVDGTEIDVHVGATVLQARELAGNEIAWA